MARVLALGLDPRFVDFSAMPPLTPEAVRAYVEAEIDRVRQSGHEVEARLISPDDAGVAKVESALRAASFDCVAIGAGLRAPPERLLLFETIVNLVHQLAPGARFAFNASPADTAQAVRRNIRSA